MSIIKLIHGSCADQNVDAIVNAANRNLLAGSGICGAIFSKAGYEELTKACNEIETPLKDGEAAITSAFNITNARKIIHAVGPNFAINPDAFDKLFLAYYNSMKLLNDNFLHTIAFPLISSGIFGGNLENPVKESTKQCIEAYFKFNQEFEDCNIEVLLCAYTESEYYDALAVFKEYKLDISFLSFCNNDPDRSVFSKLGHDLMLNISIKTLNVFKIKTIIFGMQLFYLLIEENSHSIERNKLPYRFCITDLKFFVLFL